MFFFGSGSSAGSDHSCWDVLALLVDVMVGGSCSD